MNNFRQEVPFYLQNSSIFTEILRVKEKEYDKLDADIEDFNNQFFIDKATWGLDAWENELGIRTDYSKSLEDRRSNIKAKIRGTGKVGKELIKNVADSYTNGGVDVEFKDSTIFILFNDVRGRPPNIKDTQKAIEMIIPAHLGIDFKFRYMTWNEFEKFNKTCDEWDSLNLTWTEFEKYHE